MKSMIWTLPTRLFHWMLVVYLLIMLLTAQEESWLRWHVAFGYGVAVLLGFRLVWGMVGPRYARFQSWPLSVQALQAFLRTIREPKIIYPGHNPAASWVMLGMLVTLLFVVITGVLTYGVQEGRGLFAFLNATWFKEMELFEEMHEWLTTLLWILVALHLGGVASDRVLHPQHDTLRSIFTGYKQIEATSAQTTRMQRWIAGLFLATALLLPIAVITVDETPLTQSHFASVDYESEHPLFVEECASCHTLYPPFLLPQKSWERMMETLADHFGDDASLDEVSRRAIERYLTENSAEHSTKEVAVYILQSIDEKKDIIAITQTPYWKERHSALDDALFKSKNVRTKANCKACHRGFEQGWIEDSAIAVPAQGVQR